ncbi:hypothetical protein BJV78DRAFT_1265782, partial [Lactifluus subvellereus]
MVTLRSLDRNEVLLFSFLPLVQIMTGLGDWSAGLAWNGCPYYNCHRSRSLFYFRSMNILQYNGSVWCEAFSLCCTDYIRR